MTLSKGKQTITGSGNFSTKQEFLSCLSFISQYTHYSPYCTFQNTRTPSSETKGQSVWPGEKAWRTFSSAGERAPGYRLAPDHFQTVKRMLTPDWAQKMLFIIVPNRQTASPEFFLYVLLTKVLWDGAYGLSSLSEKTWKSNRLQMLSQRQDFLLTYLKTLSVGLAAVWTYGLPLSRPALIELTGQRLKIHVENVSK